MLVRRLRVFHGQRAVNISLCQLRVDRREPAEELL